MEMDVCWKEYFRDDARYADVINGIGCGGQRLVEAKDLQEADSQTVFGKWYKVQVKDEYRGKDGKINMCQALKELIEDGRAEGRASGLADGRKEIVLRMYADGNLDVEGACMYLECTQENFMEYVKANELIQVR